MKTSRVEKPEELLGQGWRQVRFKKFRLVLAWISGTVSLVKYDVTSIVSIMSFTYMYLPTKSSEKYINLPCKIAVPQLIIVKGSITMFF